MQLPRAQSRSGGGGGGEKGTRSIRYNTNRVHMSHRPSFNVLQDIDEQFLDLMWRQLLNTCLC